MSLSRRVLTLLAVGSALAASLVSATPSVAAPTPARPGDFNGDGYPDLAVGAPGATVSGVSNAGAVAIVYGSAAGLDTTKRQRLQQGVSWVPGTPRAWERFGTDHTAADLNGDGYSDLAVCTPDQDVNGPNVGSLMLMFGSANGLNRGYEIAPGTREYCTGVAAGDFNADGYADLAVRSGFAYNGPIEVILGGPEAGFRSKLKRYGIAVVAGELSTGDVTGDGFVDLVVGAPMWGNSGGLTLYKGSPAGLVTTSPQLVRTPGSFDTAVGDVDGDGFADVAAANTQLGPSGIRYAGLVRVWYGSPAGLDTARGFTLITQDTPGVPDVAEQFDYFGDDLAIGDADGDGYAELAIGSAEKIGTSLHAGTVTVIYGSAGGLNLRRVNRLTQDSPGVPDQIETNDQFGQDLLFRDFSKPADGRADLVVGSMDDGPSNSTEGAVFLLKATSAGLSGQGSVMFGPRQVGMAPGAADFGRLN